MRRRPPQGQRNTSVRKVRWCSVAQSRRRFCFFEGEARGSDGVGAASALRVTRRRSLAFAFSDRLLVVTWVGNHDWRRMNGVSGALAAAPAAHDIFDRLSDDVRPWQAPALTFPLPSQSVAVDLCPLSGKLQGPTCPHVKTEHFVRGTEPSQPCPFHANVRIDTRTGLLAGPTCPESVVVTKTMLALPEVHAPWARSQRLSIAPTADSPLCPSNDPTVRTVRIREPATASRFLFDPTRRRSCRP
jgi:penicillin-binding protein 1C